ncbi:hypothetical protein ACSFA8_26070 [Variovorax sp. RT4R15]
MMTVTISSTKVKPREARGPGCVRTAARAAIMVIPFIYFWMNQ